MGSVDRKPYLTATVLNQAFLDACQDSLEGELRFIADVQVPGGTIHVSDRNMYYGPTFHEALAVFPMIKRSLGDWLSTDIQFSTLDIGVSNVDGRFTHFLAGGPDFAGWIGKTVMVKVGLRDVTSSYTTIYSGKVTDVGGFKRDRIKFDLITRDRLDTGNLKFPNLALSSLDWPDLEDNFDHTLLPVIYGDWTVNVRPGGASVPSTVLNGKNAGVIAGTTDIQAIISSNTNSFVDTTQVYLKRSDTFYRLDAGDVSVNGTNNILTIKQDLSGGTTLIDTTPLRYTAGDIFFSKMKGKAISGGYDDNPVAQAKDLLKTYGLFIDADFDANWATYRDKSTPAQSAISTFKSRIHESDQQEVVKYAKSLLSQVRLELFVARDLKLKINSLHFEDFNAAPSFTVKNWDIATDTFVPVLDDKNVWNRAKGTYAFDPAIKENSFSTAFFRNNAAIAQVGKVIGKEVIFPNLFDDNTVALQLKEMLKLASGYAEFIDMQLTSRAFLQDIGQFVLINVTLGATVLQNVPAMIREIGYDPNGLKIPVKVWSMQMIPFTGYSPTYAGITGGATATITQE